LRAANVLASHAMETPQEHTNNLWLVSFALDSPPGDVACAFRYPEVEH
jgi:hypothetical protein